MFYEERKRFRGRPKKKRLDVLRTKAWYIAVHLVEGLSPVALERRWPPDAAPDRREDGGFAYRSNYWRRYRIGAAVPTQPRRRFENRTIVEEVERNKLYRGTARWFYHPYWVILDPDAYPYEPAYVDALVKLGLPKKGVKRTSKDELMAANTADAAVAFIGLFRYGAILFPRWTDVHEKLHPKLRRILPALMKSKILWHLRDDPDFLWHLNNATGLSDFDFSNYPAP